jgi:hypothetical protein
MDLKNGFNLLYCTQFAVIPRRFLLTPANRVARFFLVHDTKTGKMYQMNTKCTRWSQNFPNGRKICIPNGHKILEHFPISGPIKFTQMGIFGLKTNHLATLQLTIFFAT